MEKKLSKVGKNVLRIEIISDKKLKNIEDIKEAVLNELDDERIRFMEGYLIEGDNDVQANN